MSSRVRALVVLAVGAAVGALVAGAALSFMRGDAPASPTLGKNPVAAEAANDGSNAAEESGDAKTDEERIKTERESRDAPPESPPGA